LDLFAFEWLRTSPVVVKPPLAMGIQSQDSIPNKKKAKRLTGRFPRKSRKNQLPHQEQRQQEETKKEIEFWSGGWNDERTAGCMACARDQNPSAKRSHHAHMSQFFGIKRVWRRQPWVFLVAVSTVNNGFLSGWNFRLQLCLAV